MKRHAQRAATFLFCEVQLILDFCDLSHWCGCGDCGAGLTSGAVSLEGLSEVWVVEVAPLAGDPLEVVALEAGPVEVLLGADEDEGVHHAVDVEQQLPRPVHEESEPSAVLEPETHSDWCMYQPIRAKACLLEVVSEQTGHFAPLPEESVERLREPQDDVSNSGEEEELSQLSIPFQLLIHSVAFNNTFDSLQKRTQLFA